MINKTLCRQCPTIFVLGALLNSSALFAVSATSGALVIYNGLANVASGTGIGYTASPIKIQVFDTLSSILPCSTTNNVAYNGTVVVQWSSSNTTHSSSVCGTLASVTITPLANLLLGTAIYGGMTTIPVTGSVSYTAPSTLYANMVLMPIGLATPATAVSATTWSNVLGVAPTFNIGGGDLASAGVPGVSTLNNIRARQFMRTQGIRPYQDQENTITEFEDNQNP